jgi:hypothetical protein
LYTVLPDLPRPMPFGQDKPGMSHSTYGLISNTTHHNPQTQKPNVWHTSICTNLWRTPLLSSAPYQQQYHVALPPPTSGPPMAPIIHPPIQTSSSTPSTSNYTLSTRERAIPSYVHYRSLPLRNPYFPFPGPP